MLAELIAANQPCVALTGAGISTESGVPDFRSASGVWAEYDPYEVASIDGFRRDPARAWEFYGRASACSPTASRTPATWRSRPSSARAPRGGDHPERRRPAPARRLARRDRGARLDRDRELCLVRPPRAPRGRHRPPAAPPLRRLRRRAQARRRHVRRAAARGGGRARDRARRAGGRCSSSARRSRSGRLRGCPTRRSRTAGRLAIVNRDPTPYDARAALVVHASAGETLGAASVVRG